MQKYEQYLKDADIKDADIKDWFDTANFRERTKKNYYLSFQLYIEFTGMSAAELRLEAENEEMRNVLMSRRGVVLRLREYKIWLTDPKKCGRKFAPRSIEDHVSVVQSFYRHLYITLPPKPPKGRTNKPKSLPENTIDLEIDDIRDMLQSADRLERALMLCGCAAGLAMSDLINLKVGDFLHGYDQENGITTLRKWHPKTQTYSPLIRVKTDVEFFTYLTPEASQAVLDYLEWRNRQPKKGNNPVRRQQLLKQYVTREEGYLFVLKNISDEYLDIRKDEDFTDWEKRYAELVATETDEEWQHRENMRQYHVDAFIRMYQRLAEKSDKCNIKGYNPGRSHNMRKYCSNILKNNTIPGVDNFFVEFIMGHEIPDSQKPYFTGKALLLREKYKSCVPFLTIEKSLNVTETPEYKKLKEENKIMLLETQRQVVERQELQDLRKRLEAETVERLTLQREVATTRAAIESILEEKHLDEDAERNRQAYDEWFAALSDDDKMHVIASQHIDEEERKNIEAYWEMKGEVARAEAMMEEMAGEETKKPKEKKRKGR